MKCRCLNPVHMKVSINSVITLLFRVAPFPDEDLIICFISRELCASIGLTPAHTKSRVRDVVHCYDCAAMYGGSGVG